MAEYKAKERTVKAVQWKGDNLDEVKEFLGELFIKENELHQIEMEFEDDSVQGVMKTELTDFIIFDDYLQHYIPMPKEYFEFQYENSDADWLDRLKSERNDYAIKSLKIKNFLEAKANQPLEATNAELMDIQHDLFSSLIGILDMRINLAEHKKNCTCTECKCKKNE